MEAFFVLFCLVTFDWLRFGGFCGVLLVMVWFFFETEFLCITALAVLELTLCQAGLNLRGPPASASGILGLKVCGHCLASPGDF